MEGMRLYQLTFYLPVDNAEEVKAALFAKGAGRIGHYDCCCWQTLGVGQFRPLDGSDPFIGQAGTIEKVPEYKVEMVCADELIADVVQELLRVHPYEEPAYTVVKMDLPDTK